MALAILAAGIAYPAQARQTDEQAWLQVNANVQVAKDVRVTLEQIARSSDDAGGLYQTEFGGLVGWRISPTLELGLGYRRVGFHSGNTSPDEDRLRQQLTLTIGRWVTRLRFDERFNTQAAGVGIRIRPLVRYNLPLRRQGPSLFVSHESFVLANSTAWGQRAGYERMRNTLGMTLPIGKSLSADIGYLNQYRFARGTKGAAMDHALTMQLTLNFSNLIAPHSDD
ncbi:DUF2490 domain-containing protein [Novosphingobium sp.]|uniref:DUF2490 domain-containing protein n=1 Tax=Novosphingobium sp. TaxID=1874826 RepID=UPI002632AE52|nr:DUF2490 domain-containing protein [Novosphingobium sp.]